MAMSLVARKLGTSTVQPSGLRCSPKLSEPRSRSIRSSGISTPNFRATRPRRNEMRLPGNTQPPASSGGPAARAPGQTCGSSARKPRVAVSARVGSRLFSKRALASVRRPWRAALLRIETGSKQALSSSIALVSGPISVAAPPITPARAAGRAASAITRSAGSSTRSWPSRVRRRSPGRAARTRISGPSRRARSKACMGWPRSRSRKLVRSTMFEIGLWPVAISR